MLTGDAGTKQRGEFDHSSGFDAEVERQAREAKGKAAAHAAKTAGASVSNVEKAKQLKDKDPKAFEDVKAGKKSLNAALSGKPSKESKAAQEYNAALERIEKVCGKLQADAIRDEHLMPRKPREIVAYAALSDQKMLAIRALIDQGWSVKNATHFKAEELLPTHTIRMAGYRAIYNGGKYEQDIHDTSDNTVLHIAVKFIGGAEAKAARAKTAAKKAAKKKVARKSAKK